MEHAPYPKDEIEQAAEQYGRHQRLADIVLDLQAQVNALTDRIAALEAAQGGKK